MTDLNNKETMNLLDESKPTDNVSGKETTDLLDESKVVDNMIRKERILMTLL
jgi:hypothetical protein